VGLIIEQKLSLGLLSLYLIIKTNPQTLIKELKSQGYGLTTLTAEGMKGNVKLLVMRIKRKDLKDVYTMIKNMHPDAFMSIQNVQSVKGGIMTPKQKIRWNLWGRKKSK